MQSWRQVGLNYPGARGGRPHRCRIARESQHRAMQLRSTSDSDKSYFIAAE